MLHRRMRGAGGIGPMQAGMYGAGKKHGPSAHRGDTHHYPNVIEKIFYNFGGGRKKSEYFIIKIEQ